MDIFQFLRRKHRNHPPPPTHDNGYRHPEAVKPQVGIGATLARIVPVGRIVDQLASIIRDPNGKMSSKRAGAGALVVAGIAFLNEGRTPEAIISLLFALALFALTKFPPDQEPNT